MRVFGRPASRDVAKDVMAAPTMHQTPAPAQPADVVENPNLPNYYNALDACYEILKHEADPLRRLRVEEARSFFDGVIAHFEEPDTTAQPPTPTPQASAPPIAPTMGAPGGPPGGPPTPGPSPAGASGGPAPSVPADTTPAMA